MRRFVRLWRGVRTRTALVAAGVVAVVLVVTLPLLANQAQQRVESAIDRQLHDRASAVAVLVESGLIEEAVAESGADVFTQVVDQVGVVAAATEGIEGLPRFLDAAPPPGQSVSAEVGELLEAAEEAGVVEDEGPYRVVALGVATEQGTLTVMVAASLEPARTVLSAVGSLVVLVVPALVVVVAVLVWWLTGRSLAPVEAIREEAEEISDTNLGRRVPVPDTADEIERLAVTINGMLADLDEAFQRQRRFVSDASHEMKSPVAAIRTMVDVAGSDLDAEVERPVSTDLLREIERLERLIGDLLTLARSDEGVPTTTSTEVDLDQVVGAEADAVARTSKIHVDTMGIEAVRISGDPAALARAVRNVLDNAARFAKSAISVRVAHDGDDAVVTVADDGPGIDSAEQDKVFERFYRGDPARSGSGSSGLGLAVVRAVARGHSGDARIVESALGGAAVEIRIPHR